MSLIDLPQNPSPHDSPEEDKAKSEDYDALADALESGELTPGMRRAMRDLVDGHLELSDEDEEVSE